MTTICVRATPSVGARHDAHYNDALEVIFWNAPSSTNARAGANSVPGKPCNCCCSCSMRAARSVLRDRYDYATRAQSGAYRPTL